MCANTDPLPSPPPPLPSSPRRLYKMLSSPQATTEADVALVVFNQVVGGLLP
jgi:hypothetical protein